MFCVMKRVWQPDPRKDAATDVAHLSTRMIPRAEGSNPLNWVSCATTSQYEPITLSPAQAFQLAQGFPQLEKTLTWLAAGTGLRISECLGLQWQDLDFEQQRIHVRRTWIDGVVGKPKTQASGKPVPMAALLAVLMKDWHQETPYAGEADWVFPLLKLKGKQPRTGGAMAQDYLRPAAVKLGVLTKDDPRRFGFHHLRHCLASYLVTEAKTDPRTV